MTIGTAGVSLSWTTSVGVFEKNTDGILALDSNEERERERERVERDRHETT